MHHNVATTPALLAAATLLLSLTTPAIAVPAAWPLPGFGWPAPAAGPDNHPSPHAYPSGYDAYTNRYPGAYGFASGSGYATGTGYGSGFARPTGKYPVVSGAAIPTGAAAHGPPSPAAVATAKPSEVVAPSRPVETAAPQQPSALPAGKPTEIPTFAAPAAPAFTYGPPAAPAAPAAAPAAPSAAAPAAPAYTHPSGPPSGEGFGSSAQGPPSSYSQGASSHGAPSSGQQQQQQGSQQQHGGYSGGPHRARDVAAVVGHARPSGAAGAVGAKPTGAAEAAVPVWSWPAAQPHVEVPTQQEQSAAGFPGWGKPRGAGAAGGHGSGGH